VRFAARAHPLSAQVASAEFDGSVSTLRALPFPMPKVTATNAGTNVSQPQSVDTSGTTSSHCFPPAICNNVEALGSR